MATRKNTRSARLKDKQRKQKQRQEVIESFTYLPVDHQWQNDQIDKLGLPVPHFPTTSTPLASQNALPLTDPTMCHKITADGNCFFSALSFIVTRNQRYYNLFRQKICDFMKANSNILETYLPAECNGDMREYLKNSKMETDREWATEVEIFAASTLLKTNIFVYSKTERQWKWIKYSSVRTEYNNGIFIYHMNEDHFDLVVAVKNSNLMDGISQANCFTVDDLNKKKSTPEKRKYSSDKYHQRKIENPNFQNLKNCLERQRYMSDNDFASKKQKAVNKKYRDAYREQKKNVAKARYCTNPFYRAILRNISKMRYKSSDSYRSSIKHSSTRKYNENEEFRKKVKDSSVKKYCENEEFRKKVKDSSVKKYCENEEFRKKVKDSSVKKYCENEEFRKKVKDSSVKKYCENEEFRKKVKDSSVKKYCENEEFRKKIKDSSVKKYCENEEFRKKVKDSSVKKYCENEEFRKKAKDSSVKKYCENEEFRKKVKDSSVKKYCENEEFRKKVKDSSVKKYCENEEFRKKVKDSSVKKYCENEEFRKKVKDSSVKKYCENEEFRKKVKDSSVKKYCENEEFTKKVKDSSVKKYCENEEFRKKVKDSSVKKYCENEEFRKKVKDSSVKKYCENEEFRKKVKDSSVKKYCENEEFGKKVKDSSVKKYCENEEFTKKVKDSSVKKYCENEEFRKKVKDSSVKKYCENRDFRENVKERSLKKYRENEDFRNNVKASSIKNYRENEDFRKKLKRFCDKRYRENENFRQRVKDMSKKRYTTFDTFKTNLKISSIKKYHSNALFRAKLKRNLKMVYNHTPTVQQRKKASMNIRRQSISIAISKFKKSINDIPSYICTVCIRTLYRSQVKPCKRNRYMIDGELHEMAAVCLTGKYVHQCDQTPCNCKGTRSKEWICHTCDRHLSNGHMPPQSQANNLTLLAIPEVLQRLNALEKQLVALRIPFMKILSLPRGGQKGVKGPMVNVPTDLNKVTTTLPRTTNEAEFVKVKLKRKLEYKGHYQYEWVNPQNVIEAMRYLIDNNFWYSHIVFNDSWLDDSNDPDLIREEAPDTDSENEDDKNETPNTSSDFPIESCLQPLDLGQEYLDTTDKIFSVAPAEHQSPLSIFSEKGIDAMSFPTLLPDGNFGLSADRDIKLSPSKYFNVRLFSADQRFASDNQFIFFAQYVTELTDIISKMSIALRKGKAHTNSGENVTASMLTDSDNLRNILKSDVGFRFLQPIRGSPPYWQRTMKDLYSMIHQLGIPTWFITFSAAETRWEEVIRTLLNQSSDNRDVNEIEWTEKCQLIRENPVTCARLFDHRVKSLFSDLLLSTAQPIGPVADFFFRTEFQSRGSPHIHCLVWIKNAPKLEDSSDTDICNFVDQYISCELPNQEDDPELFDIVTSVQIHSKNHTASCRKHSSTCRFHFPRTPVKNTFIARTETDDEGITDDKKLPPTEEELTEMSRASNKTPKKIVREVWTVISSLQSYENLNIDKILQMVNVTYQQFEDALKAMCTKNTIYHKRKLTDCWVNNYNKDLLRAWNANLDIQYVMDAYSCIAYILSYISKAEAEMGDLLKNAKKEAEDGNSDVSATMKKISQVYLQNREVSAQEAIYRVCSMHLKRCSREITFIPTGSKPLKMSLPINVIKNKQGNDGNIWMTSIIEKYYKRPDNETFNTMCLADFCSKYTVLPMSKKPKTSSQKKSLPVYELQQDMGYLKQKQQGKESVIRYPRFNRVKQREEFYMTMVQLYLPHRSPNIKPEQYHSYEEFVRTGGIIDMINENRKRYELDAEDIEKAWEDLQEGKIREDAWSIIASEAESERLDIEMEKIPEDQDMEVEEIPELLVSADEQRQRNINPSVEIVKPNLTTKQINDMMSQLNEIQQGIFYKVRDWCLKKTWKQTTEPFQLFINGGAGTGKTHLVKCIYYEATRILSKLHENPESTPVIMTAPTGTAAFAIEGNTLHSTFSISKTMTLPYVPLSENLLNTLRSKFENLHLIVTDEISMVDHKLLSYVHGRLCQLKQSKKLFGNISVIAVGDFHQLSPVRASPLFKKKESAFSDLWNSVFSVATLTEIMRQKDDVEFAQMLNRIRTYTKEHPLEERDLNMLKSRSYDTVPDEAMNYLHIFPTNKEVNNHNEDMVQKLCNPLYTVLARDFTKDISTGEMRKRATPFSTNSNEDLLSSFSIGINARIMLTRNIDTEDGLVNGAFGTIKAVDKNQAGQILAVYIKFDHPKCGKKHIAKCKVRDQVRKNLVKIVRIDETMQGRNITRKQYPFKLGWAATIHKVQGMTMDNVVVSLKKIFQPGMAYVALSRARSLNGLHIINFDANVIYASSDVKTAIDKMPPFIKEYNRFNKPDNSVCSILLHNTEGLVPHQHDVKCQKIIQSVDIVCFTETWMNNNNTMPKAVLPNHTHHTLSRSDAYDQRSQEYRQLALIDRGGVATFVNKKLAHHRMVQRTTNMECITCIIDTEQKFALSVIYRPPTYQMELFCRNLHKLLTELDNLQIPTILSGDFNDNISKISHMKTVFSNFGYQQLVMEPTTQSGSTLDHVYVKGFRQQPDVKVIPLYYSFHEAVEMNILV